MSTAKALSAFATAAAWRVTRSARLGASLAGIAAGSDEDASTVAGMFLTRAGARAVPVVRDAVAAGAVDLVGVLVSIGSDDAHQALVDLAAGARPGVAAAATEGLERLERIRRHTE